MTSIPTRIVAPGLRRPQLVSEQRDGIFVWAEVDETKPVRSCVMTVHGTGHPINDDETYIGTLIEGIYVWHYYATEPS